MKTVPALQGSSSAFSQAEKPLVSNQLDWNETWRQTEIIHSMIPFLLVHLTVMQMHKTLWDVFFP